MLKHGLRSILGIDIGEGHNVPVLSGGGHAAPTFASTSDDAKSKATIGSGFFIWALGDRASDGQADHCCS